MPIELAIKLIIDPRKGKSNSKFKSIIQWCKDLIPINNRIKPIVSITNSISNLRQLIKSSVNSRVPSFNLIIASSILIMLDSSIGFRKWGIKRWSIDCSTSID